MRWQNDFHVNELLAEVTLKVQDIVKESPNGLINAENFDLAYEIPKLVKEL